MAAKLKIPSLAEIEADEEDSSTKKQPLFKTHRHVKWDEEDKKELSNSTVSKVKNTSQLTSTSTAATSSALGTMGHIQTESPQSSGTILSGPVRTNENVVAGTSSLNQKPMSRGNMQSSKISQVMTSTKPTILAGATTTCTTAPVAPVCDKEAAVPLKPGKPNSIVVSPKQRGNPVLKHIRNVPWEFGDIVPDYVLGQTTCALFLSLRYHHLNPNYIHERLKLLGYSYDLRILLVQVDVKDPHNSLKELAKICILADCTLILAWSPEEAGRYLETYKSFESKPPDLIMEKTDSNLLGRVSDCLSTVKKVNKPDTTTLLSEFGSMDEIIKADQEKLALCPGFGPQKAVRLFEVFHTPFLKSKKVRQVESPQRAKRKTEKEEAEPSSTS